MPTHTISEVGCTRGLFKAIWRPTSERIWPGENLSEWPEIARALTNWPKFYKNHCAENPWKFSRGLMLSTNTLFFASPLPWYVPCYPLPLYIAPRSYVKPSLKKAFEFDRTQQLISYIVLLSDNAVLEAFTAKRGIIRNSKPIFHHAGMVLALVLLPQFEQPLGWHMKKLTVQRVCRIQWTSFQGQLCNRCLHSQPATNKQ